MKMRHGALILFLCAVMPLHAEVIYVRDISMPAHLPVLPLTKAPIDTADPLYNPALPDTQWIFTGLDPFTRGEYYTFDPVSGTVSGPLGLPLTMKTDNDSLAALSGAGTSEPTLNVLGFRNTLYRFNTKTGLQAPPLGGVPVPLGAVSSLAAPNRADLTAIAADGLGNVSFNTINIATGAVTQKFAFTDGTLDGEFSTDTFYHAYAPNGFVYLLDYGNDRMQWLDPANDFAYVGAFTLETGVTTANMQFAIGSTGNIYLGDGLGGGSTYDADGTFLGSFALPDTVTGDEFLGVPYVSTDQGGHVYIFDDTGFHQYLDASVVPEPSVMALLIGAGTLSLAIARRRRRNP